MGVHNVVVYPCPKTLIVGESDITACGPPAIFFSVHLGLVNKSRGDNVGYSCRYDMCCVCETVSVTNGK